MRNVFSGVLLATLLFSLYLLLAQPQPMETKPILLGFLCHLSGPGSANDQPRIAAVKMAVDEINRKGGLLGRRVQVISMDLGDDPHLWAERAGSLIDQGVCSIIGSFTSDVRKAILPVLEKRKNLLFYATPYEGEESSPNIIYLGGTSNQLIVPTLKWACLRFGRRVYLIGSDFVYPRTCNRIIRSMLGQWHGEVLGEVYLGPDSPDNLVAVADEIERLKPDIIFNTLLGDDLFLLTRELRRRGITAPMMPQIGFGLTENTLRLAEKPEEMAGDFTTATYFQSLDSHINDLFVQKFLDLGISEVIDSRTEAQYCAVHLWAMAVKAAGSISSMQIRASALGKSFQGPGGVIYIDSQSQHVWRRIHIGQIRADGQVEVLWRSDQPIKPAPFLMSP